MALGRSRYAIAARAPCTSFDTLKERNEAMPFERKPEVGEHRALDRDRKRAGRLSLGTIDDACSAAGEGNAEGLAGRKNQRAVDHRNERRIHRRRFHRLGERRSQGGGVPHGGQGLRQAFEQGNVGAHQKNRRHVVLQLCVMPARRRGKRILWFGGAGRQSLDEIRFDPIDLDRLGPRRFSRHDPDRMACDIELIGQKHDERGVRCAIHRRCGEPHLERIAMHAAYLAA